MPQLSYSWMIVDMLCDGTSRANGKHNKWQLNTDTVSWHTSTSSLSGPPAANKWRLWGIKDVVVSSGRRSSAALKLNSELMRRHQPFGAQQVAESVHTFWFRVRKQRNARVWILGEEKESSGEEGIQPWCERKMREYGWNLYKSVFDIKGITGYAGLPFAEQKTVSGVVFVSETPILFQRSRNVSGLKCDDRGPFSCYQKKTKKAFKTRRFILWCLLSQTYFLSLSSLTSESVCRSKDRTPSQSPQPEGRENWGWQGREDKGE